MVKRHPLDFDKIKKGDVVAISELEEIFGIDRSDDRFGLRRLGLADRIEREMRDRGKPVSVRTQKGALAILTDPEAAEHNPRSVRLGFRRMIRSHRKSLEVDTTNLSDGQRKTLEHNIVVQAKMISGARDGRRLALKATERTVPPALGSPLPAPKGEDD